MNKISVKIVALNHDELKHQWCGLYTRAEHNIFLSWHWMSCWLEQLDSSPLICQASCNDEIVGLALLTQKTYLKYGFIPTKQLFLHKSGDESLDQVWIEYNDFLLDKTSQNEVRLAMLDFITAKIKWDELHIGASEAKVLASCTLSGLIKNDRWVNQSYKTDLATLRTNDTEYLAQLSKNTRYQINRSLKAYEAMGPITIEFAQSTEQALLWFAECGPLHIKRWSKTRVGSGYSNPNFVSFHQTLIKDCFDDGKIHLLKISAGNNVICYLYNLLEGKDVKFYLAATDFNNTNKKLKPGLIAHYLAIKEYTKRGADTYDFMAGESQYKRSLSSSSSRVLVSCFQRNSLRTKIETKLRKIKQTLRSSANTGANKSTYEVTLTGGRLKPDGQKNYDQARIIKLKIDKDIVSLTSQYTHDFSSSVLSENTDQIFKSASYSEDSIIVVTETDIVEISPDTLQLKNQYSAPCFNDMHHAVKYKNGFLVANTGLDNVVYFDKENSTTELLPAMIGANLTRFKSSVDYRLAANTKPHFAHPNFIFELNGEPWVTRCDNMDALCLVDHSKRIELANELVHDGVVFKNNIYFTTVDGQIKVFNTESLELRHSLQLNEFIPNVTGWCRGILPISTNLTFVGLSKVRRSKKSQFLPQQNHARLLLIDIFERKLICDIDVSQFGIDAIFSILPGEL